MSTKKQTSLIEGFTDSVGSAIRGFFARSPQAQSYEIQRGGSPSVERAGLPYNLVSQFGYDSLAQHLRIDQDLQTRYTDYEEMDEYPELSCLHGDSPVFTMEHGWVPIRDLVGQDFHVLAYDKTRRSLVPAPGTALISGEEGHAKPMVRVTLDNGEQITCTSDHPFLTKDEKWIEAGDLVAGQRLMPGNVRLRSLNAADAAPYWQVHQPHADSDIRSSDGKRWVWLHRLVAEVMLGVEPGQGHIVHHEDHDQLNNAPSNLSVETASTHAEHHIAGIDNSHFFPEWTDERRAEQAEKMRGNTFSRGARRSAEHRAAIGRAARRPKSAAHRRKIGLSQPNRIDIPVADLEAALREAGTVSGAAKLLGVSWSTVKRRAEAHDLLADGGNHRVLRVERLDERPAIYDLHVPGFHNFVAHGVVVHNTALDIYADDSTIPDMERSQSIWVTSENQGVSRDLDDMLHQKIGVEDDLWGNARTISKYGNNYGELLVAEQGVIGLNYLPPPTIRRVEGPRGELLGFVQDTRGEFNLNLEDFYKLAKQRGTAAERNRAPGELTVFEDWELIHWRLRGKHLRSVYGHSVVDPARWIWKRLALLEDALLIYKLERAPARYAFYIDVGDLDQERGLAFVNRVKNQFVKKKFVNPATGKIDMRHNPLAHDEDFFVPTRQGKDSTRIEVLQGPDYAETDTVEYHRDKLVAAVKIPKLYMGYGGESTRAALSSEDIRFARTVMRIQRSITQGYRQACRVHLIAQGMSAQQVDAYDYDVRMTPPSAIMELAKLEVMSATADVADRLGERTGSKYVLTKLFKFTEEEAVTLMKERDQEQLDKAKIEGRAQAIIQNASIPTQGAGEMQFAHRDTGSDPLLERRLANVVRSSMKSWEREFEGKRRSSEWNLEDRMAKLIANDPRLNKRLQRVEGLLQEVKRSLR